MIPSLRQLFVVILLFQLTSLPSAIPAQATYDDVPILRTAESVLAPRLQRGDGWEVAPQVESDGYMNHYRLETDFGTFDVEGDELLEVRVGEVDAIRRLKELSRTTAFAKAIAGSVQQTADQVGTLITEPRATLRGVPDGVARRARGLWYNAKRTVRKAGQVAGEVRASFAEDEEPSERDAVSTTDDASTMSRVGDKALDLLGFESSRRQLAARLRVDPYSSNEVLNTELDRVAMAALAANLGFSALDPIPDPVKTATQVHELVWQTPPRELERLNDESLKEIGASGAVRFDFLENSWYSPSEQTTFVRALRALGAVPGSLDLLESAAEAEAHTDVRYLIGVTSLLARYHDQHDLVEIRRVPGGGGFAFVGLRGAAGGVVPAPFDYLAWLPGFDDTQPLQDLELRDLWLTGDVTPLARDELERRGWRIRTHVPIL